MVEVSASDIPAPYAVAALYRFARTPDPDGLRVVLEAVAESNDIRGTLLVATEGVNGTIAGSRAGLEAVIARLREEPGFAELEVKWSQAQTAPFHRLKVRVKAEIVTLGRPDVDAARDAGAYVEPEDWNALIADPDTVVIDTRNAYEGRIGAFEGAIQPNTATFRDFPDWFRNEGAALLNRPDGAAPKVAMYCTGGIRCEKATALLKAEGVQDVYHLKGGVLRYLETVPKSDSLWRGECFVFDERVAVGHGLAVGDHVLCRACREPVDAAGRASPHYVEGVSCDRCHETQDQRRDGRAERQRQVEIARAKGIDHIGLGAARRMRMPRP